MTTQRGRDERETASELFARARQLERERDYYGAQECYERSLRLREDEEVRAAYLALLATIGPM